MDETSKPNPAQASGRKLPAVRPKPGELDLRTAYVTLLKAYERQLRACQQRAQDRRDIS